MRIPSCQACDLCVDNSFVPVSGRGAKHPIFMFIGEAPGYTEYKKGSPFVGKSGKYLQSFIDDAHVNEISYVTNAVKCRPPANREPFWNEITTCRIYIEAELKVYNPNVVILLGRTAVNSYFNCYIPTLKKLVNRPFKYKGRIVYITWHPSYIIRTPEMKGEYNKLFSFLNSYYKLLNPLHK